jgi:hypothetical protein
VEGKQQPRRHGHHRLRAWTHPRRRQELSALRLRLLALLGPHAALSAGTHTLLSGNVASPDLLDGLLRFETFGLFVVNTLGLRSSIWDPQVFRPISPVKRR